MQNYKKLLFAGLAIVPLALSSWTSEGDNVNYSNPENVQVSSDKLIGNTVASQTVTVSKEKTQLSVSSVKEVDRVSSTVATSLEPVLTFDRVLESYK